jgi:CheY-like chemotaxis protein/anti-sigma regulatory factor (Ser/Thr protein kinase)
MGIRRDVEIHSQADEQPRRLALVVDDDAVNRMILESMLTESGFDVITAADGQQGVEAYAENEPDVILMDIMMPVLDGYQATRRIKELAGEHFVPIIFLTAVTDEDELAKCVTVGGDAFLTKPYSKVIIMAKVTALIRLSELYATTQRQRDEIDIHNEQMLVEQKVAKKIYSRVVHEGCLDTPNLKYILSPLAIFNGDLLLAARTPSGGLNILLGDATGHGLPAAIGAVPISDLFYELTEDGATVDEIVLEINSKLKNILPPEFFFCASVCNFSNDYRLFTIWHGGLPDVLIYSAEQRKIKHVIASTNFPLGVVNNERLKTDLQIFDLSKGDRVYLYSDGITETRNMDGQEFSQERLMRCFQQTIPAGEMFSYIMETVNKFRGAQDQSDDLTLLEINADPDLFVEDYPPRPATKPILPYPSDWNMNMMLKRQDLIETNPVSILTKFTSQVDGLLQHREDIFIVLSELYNNALDHGVLKLDSSIKSQSDGFLKYLMLRQQQLSKLEDGYIVISLEHKMQGDQGALVINITDSGEGFNYEKLATDLENNKAYSGRGCGLVKSLCQDLKYYGKGNHVQAIYHWNKSSS